MNPGNAPRPRKLGRFALLWLAGIDLRITLLCVPPMIPAIHRDLGLNEKGIALLTGLPVLLLAFAAVPGSLLVSRIGARRAIIAGLLVVAIAGALRGAGPSTAALLAMTLVMGVGIAVMQPAFPTVVRQWLPDQVGRATAVYSNGLLLGEVIAAALTIPVVLPLVGQSWGRGLATWSLPVIACAALMAFFTPHARAARDVPRVRWWPHWRSAATWRMGLVFGAASMLYWGFNAFIPDYLRGSQRAGLIAPALTFLNLAQIPASLLIAGFPRSVGRRSAFIGTGILTLLSVVGFLAMPGVWAVVWAGAAGFCAAAILVLVLALPPLIAAPDDVHRLSAGIFTITYSCSFFGPLVAGALWDATGVGAAAFLPALIAGPAIILLALGLQLPQPGAQPRGQVEAA